jgi:uncharacterized protein YqgV (UPF0045/DUF77 family)
MQITVEISLYPLQNDYEQIILDFIKTLHQHEGLTIEINGLSTQVFGEYDIVMNAIQIEMKALYEERQAVLLLKMGRGHLKYPKES